MKSVYIAARAKYRAAEVAEIQKKVQQLGFQIAYDWPSGNNVIKKPYRLPANRKANLAAQNKMLLQAAKADIFIFIDEPGLRGAYVELGAFLTDCLNNSKGRRAYIVGPNSHEREFIFESPDYVKFADTIDEVYQDLKTGV
jgi:hypothetical protein